jgi:HSP20 family protein
MNMALMRRQDVWDPIRELEEIGNRFSRLFGMARPGGDVEREGGAMTAWTPAVDIVETDKEYRLRLELPDVNKEDVHITLENGVLTVQGERKEEREEGQGRFHRRELKYGMFLRRFTLPEDVDPERVDASFKVGILTIAIPKSEEKQAKPKEIAVH